MACGYVNIFARRRSHMHTYLYFILSAGQEGQLVCVELVAQAGHRRTAIFQGSVPYGTLITVCASWTKNQLQISKYSKSLVNKPPTGIRSKTKQRQRLGSIQPSAQW